MTVPVSVTSVGWFSLPNRLLRSSIGTRNSPNPKYPYIHLNHNQLRFHFLGPNVQASWDGSAGIGNLCNRRLCPLQRLRRDSYQNLESRQLLRLHRRP